jgi:hypothetical protein
MRVGLGDADAAVGIALQVVTDFLGELARIGRLPTRVEFDRDLGGQIFHVLVLLDPPVLEMVTNGPDAPRTRLRLTGTIEARPAADPNADPIVVGLNAAVRLTIVLVPADPVPAVGFRYDGVDGQPSPPVTAADIDAFMNSPEIQQILSETQIPIAASLVEGLNATRFPEEGSRPDASAWSVRLTLTPAASGSVDAFAVSAGSPGTLAALQVTESFVAPRMGLAVAYNRTFLDLVLGRGADAREGQTVEGAEVQSPLTIQMADDGIFMKGHVIKEIDTPLIDVAPDVDIRFDGVAIPQLIRGTTAMTMDTDGIDVDVDDTDEIFYGALQWVLTIGASALLFTGVGSLTALGIVLWLTVVQEVWNKAVDLDNAPNVLRESLAASLGAQLSLLAQSLDDSTPAGELSVDGTPDSMVVVDGNIVLFAQVLIVPMRARLRSAEYSKKLRRFAIFELDDRRKFRAQELARLMKAGKVTLSGFHHVGGDYIRSDHDNALANNLLQSFEDNETREIVVKNLK